MSRLACIVLLVASSACGDRIAGASIDLAVQIRPLELSAHDNQARPVTAGWLTISISQVLECPSMARRVWNELSPLGSAWAHGTPSPTRLAVPHVLDLTSAETVAMGTFKPPPGRWCALHLSLGPADADAEGLGSAPMIGRTLVLQASTELGATSETVGVDFDFSADPIVLNEEHPHSTLTLVLDTSAWVATTSLTEPRLAGAGQQLFSLTPKP